MAGVLYKDTDRLLVEESFPGEVNDFDDQIGADGNLDTNRSVEVNSFNRLYYEGL